MPLDNLQDVGGDIVGIVPMALEPLLKNLNFATELDIEFDVVRQARNCEVARSDERGGSDDGLLCVGDVGLGVEFFFRVHAAIDLPGSKRLDDRRARPSRKSFFSFSLSMLESSFFLIVFQPGEQRLLRALGDLIPHEDADLSSFCHC